MDEPPQLRAVLFDLDGTLFDSEREGHRVAFNTAFERAGLDLRWDAEHYGELLALAGGRRRIQAALAAAGVGAEAAEALAGRLHREKTEIFRQMCADGAVLPRPGACRLVAELAGAGIRVGVATTGSREWVEPLLERSFGPVFELLLTGTEVGRLKPDPAVYRESLALLGLRPREAVAVEDSAIGVAAACGAGLRCVAVANDYTLDQDLSSAAAVFDGFGSPSRPARRLVGAALPLPDGSVGPETLRAALGAEDPLLAAKGAP